MVFYRNSIFVFVIAFLLSNGFFHSINSTDEVLFDMKDDEIAMSNLRERRSFFHLFNVPYIICFFAAKGKWPFFPHFMQVQVDQVGRSIFPQSDSFIRSYCEKWIQIKECFRPHNIIPVVHETPAPMTEPPEPINTEVETFPTDPPTTPCSCAQRNIEHIRPAPIVFFDKNYIGNVSSDTIKNTIQFLQGFLPPTIRTTTKKPKRRIKIRERI